MEQPKKINTALISVFDKKNLEKVIRTLDDLRIKILSTGGTFDYIEKLGINVTSVESLTSYPSILGGRVKTLHPKIFGGILNRRNNDNDQQQLNEFGIPLIDLVIVDLYPFEETIKSTDDEHEIIEKIDIGGISLIRAAAKNYQDVLVVPSTTFYDQLIHLLNTGKGYTSLADRKYFATQAFNVSSHYDSLIFTYFNNDGETKAFKQSIIEASSLRYGENPHQASVFYGKLDDVFDKLHGKEISYNNIGDLDAAISLINEFDETTFAIIKHTNACGVASRSSLAGAWTDALAGDPVSAFGGVLITNAVVDTESASEINKLFFEIILAPGYEKNALDLLMLKKNRIILQKKSYTFPDKYFRSALNGVLEQSKDIKTESVDDMRVVTFVAPGDQELTDLVFANKIVKHSKSNAIVLAKNKQLLGSGVGQTSRVDALKQAIQKARSFGFDLNGAVMASDAFFPFADSVDIAYKAGISAIVQPGGSVRDAESVDYCNKHRMTMVFTGTRHFKH
ncbi:MAG: bifunctional phosphoribosylaminoimidazolecarboxamide formyltransferase/IMP cyclohydrolase [Bacteroidetes bacterium]|nr:bifunctional phosphoribosylaminoimidazolecarboxamide formyltransferase/IMP cyclohydrolase [Bacteroidota bacterium]